MLASLDILHQSLQVSLAGSTHRLYIKDGLTTKMATISYEIYMWRGVVCNAAAGAMDAPARHLQSCLVGLKICTGS